MDVVVTGAAGFVGSCLCRRLLALGHRVFGLDALIPRYDPAHFERRLRDLRANPDFWLVKGDLCDEDALSSVFRLGAPQAVIHLAALASVRASLADPAAYGRVNMMGTMNLLEAARRHRVPHVVVASSGSVYGADTPLPFSEAAPADRPLSPYGASKRAMELAAWSYAYSFGLNVTVLRLFNVYGPFGRPDMMPFQWAMAIDQGRALTLYDGGRLKRDWTFIEDALDGILAALAEPGGYRLFNLGRGEPVENLRFVRELERLLGKPARIQEAPAPPTEQRETWADTSRARRELGYEPKVSVAEGLERFVRWLRDEGLVAA
ncbi:MAG: NAD-dependent epimerase/dehydratase family protein [Fimbriimonadales bacterium]|nr:NAD-dependent epimerase/dehydratase family protein [Fimbriimonadales bacterium]